MESLKSSKLSVIYFKNVCFVFGSIIILILAFATTFYLVDAKSTLIGGANLKGLGLTLLILIAPGLSTAYIVSKLLVRIWKPGTRIWWFQVFHAFVCSISFLCSVCLIYWVENKLEIQQWWAVSWLQWAASIAILTFIFFIFLEYPIRKVRAESM